MRSRNITSLLLVCLFFVVISIGIGYAYVRDSLSLNGNSTLASNSFNVYFDNIVINKETARVNTAANIYNDGKSVGFNVTLTKPGDTYDFYVDVVNGGSIDAMVGIVPSIEIPDEYKDVVLYKINYEDGLPLRENDLLKAANNDTDRANKINVVTLHIVMKYKLSTNNEQLVTTDILSFSVNFDIPYVQAKDANVVTKNSLYELIASNAVRDDIQSEFVTSETGIDYTYQSSDTNGKGLYKYREQISEDYPIYYYRGEVYDNNVIFANYCWKIVRTTETGGIKLIYNGTPSNGVCNNANNDDVLPKTDFLEIGTGELSTQFRYVFGDSIEYLNFYFSGDEINGIVFGNDIVYENGRYKLIDIFTADSSLNFSETLDKIAKNHHYTCGTNQSECTEVYYIMDCDYPYSDKIDFKFTTEVIKNGLYLSDIFDEIFGKTGKYSSLAKKKIDTFYKNNLIDYENNLDDAVWCIDSRFRINPFDKDVDLKNADWYPAFYYRYRETYLPDITCDVKDSFTVNNTSGNGKFNYMTAMITLDELMLAGYNKKVGDYYGSIVGTNTFLNASAPYFTMSNPGFYGNTYAYVINKNGVVDYTSGSSSLRPMISLRNDILYTDGDGTSENPYIIAER